MNASKAFTPPLRRHGRNPILRPQDMPMECSAVFNCGAVRFGEKVLLLLRVENYRRLTTFHVATSRDGLAFDVCPDPIDYPLRETETQWVANRFDMRITPLEGTYYVCHASWLGKLGCGIGIAQTDDFVRFEAVGEISAPSNRNAVLFPRKIGGRYVRLERPQNIDGSGQIWVSRSPDLIHWGDARPLDMPYNGWSHTKTGAGAIPIETPAGWLLVYHATSKTASSENYYLGAMLVDLETPSRVVAAPTRFLLQPEELYECVGQVPNVVFTGGAVEMPDGTLNVYYGGADTRICLAQTTVAELVDFCLAERAR
ncbi:MAG TPA: glycosidase [Phycisphaerales bacterium]|nr:glycosidase [Phycisphaerales bacterium]